MVNPHPSNAKVTPQGGSHHSSGGGTGDSSVGTRSLYQADDQRNSKQHPNPKSSKANENLVHKEGDGPVSGEYDTQKKVLEGEQNSLNIKDPLRPVSSPTPFFLSLTLIVPLFLFSVSLSLPLPPFPTPLYPVPPRLPSIVQTHKTALTNEQATLHGNEPSRGAKTDAMLHKEDMEELSKKEHAGKGMGGASG
jgi:hypothetical protein